MALLDPNDSILASPSPYRDDNFKLVTRSEGGAAMLALRHDFAIAFDGDALARVAELFDQAGNGQRGRKLAAFAIDLEGKHPAILTSRAASSARR